MIKLFYILGATSLFFLAIACKKAVVKPDENVLVGTWIIFQHSFWDGNQLVVKDIIALPQSPTQTLSFTASGDVSTTEIKDTILTQAQHYNINYSDLIGPQIFLQKADLNTYATLGFIAYHDTLTINVLGQGNGYRFYRFIPRIK